MSTSSSTEDSRSLGLFFGLTYLVSWASLAPLVLLPVERWGTRFYDPEPESADP